MVEINVKLTLLIRELAVTTRVAQLRRAQALIHQYVPESVSLADELISERKLEQRAEDAR